MAQVEAQRLHGIGHACRRAGRLPRRSARTAARAVSSDVKQGMRFSTAARLIWKPSRMAEGPPPSGVLTTQSTFPCWMTSTTLGWPSLMRFVTCSTVHAQAADHVGGAFGRVEAEVGLARARG